MTPRIRIVDGHRTYQRADEQVRALLGVTVELDAGEFVAVTGPSGSGKSTLLLVLAGWERLDTGTVEVFDDAGGVRPAELGWNRLGFVPQGLGLLDDLTAEENAMLPARLNGRSARCAADDEYTRALMKCLDIDRLASAMSNELSLGEQQRVAVVRALALRQPVVLADEPSTHQDAAHGAAVFDVLRAAADGGATVVVATHDPDGLRYADRILAMADGTITESRAASPR